MDLEILTLTNQIEIVEDTKSRFIHYFYKLNTNFETQVMHILHLTKYQCQEYLLKALLYVLKGTGLDPECKK
jgi:hypothetical protein